MEKVTKAVIAAAGLSSRMFPYAKVESKLMIPILNKPVIEYLVEEMAASGIKEIVIVSSHIGSIKAFFSDNKKLDELLKRLKREDLLQQIHHIETTAKIDMIRQDEPFGWMHEVVHAKDILKNSPFVVSFSDVLYTSEIPASKQVIDAFYKSGKNIAAEGRFVLKPSVFGIAEKEKFELGKDLADIDVFDKLKEKNDLIRINIKGRFHDIGNPLSYLKTQAYFGLQDKVFGKEFGDYLKEIQK